MALFLLTYYNIVLFALLKSSRVPLKTRLVIITDKGVRLMISILGSLSFAKLVMMSSATAKSAGDARYASQDPFIR